MFISKLNYLPYKPGLEYANSIPGREVEPTLKETECFEYDTN